MKLKALRDRDECQIRSDIIRLRIAEARTRNLLVKEEISKLILTYERELWRREDSRLV